MSLESDPRVCEHSNGRALTFCGICHAAQKAKEPTDAELLEGLARTAGKAMAIGVSAGDWDVAEEAADLGLKINDSKEGA